MTELIFFFLLLCKHAIADLALQSRLDSYGTKTNLRTPRLWIHCLDHAMLTFFVTLLIVGVVNALWLFLLDFVAHFTIDYIKSVHHKRNGIVTGKGKYWTYAAVDQIAHYTTYLGLVVLTS